MEMNDSAENFYALPEHYDQAAAALREVSQDDFPNDHPYWNEVLRLTEDLFNNGNPEQFRYRLNLYGRYLRMAHTPPNPHLRKLHDLSISRLTIEHQPLIIDFAYSTMQLFVDGLLTDDTALLSMLNFTALLMSTETVMEYAC